MTHIKLSAKITLIIPTSRRESGAGRVGMVAVGFFHSSSCSLRPFRLMLIHLGKYQSEFAPVGIYFVDEISGNVFIGDEKARIMLSREEVARLYELLRPFVQSPKS